MLAGLQKLLPWRMMVKQQGPGASPSVAVECWHTLVVLIKHLVCSAALKAANRKPCAEHIPTPDQQMLGTVVLQMRALEYGVPWQAPYASPVLAAWLPAVKQTGISHQKIIMMRRSHQEG